MVSRLTEGHVLDIPPNELAEHVLTRQHNFHMRRGFPTRIGGRRIAYSQVTGDIDPLHLLNVSLNTSNWWMLFGPSTIRAAEGANEYDISMPAQLTVTDPHEWTSALLNGIPIFNNGKNAPHYWTGDSLTDAVPLPGWPVGTICKGICVARYHVFAFNIETPSGVFDNMVMHSDAAPAGAVPGSWTPGPTTEAGELILSDTVGRCVAGLLLGPLMLMYKPASLYAIEYNGQQGAIFTQRCVSASIGALGPNCVKEIIHRGAIRHLVVGNDDVVITDGVNVESIAADRIKYALANTLDETYARNTFVVRDLNKRETWIGVPEAGNQFATVAHVWDEARNKWSTRDLYQTRHAVTGYVTDLSVDRRWDAQNHLWDNDHSLWNAGTVGSIARVVTAQPSTVYVEDVPVATSLTSYLIREDLNLDMPPDVLKVTQKVMVEGTNLAGVQVRLGSRNSVNESIAWQGFQDIDPDGTSYEVEGRLISIQIRHIGENTPSISRFLIEALPNGTY